MDQITDLGLEHCRRLFRSERSRREPIRSSASTAVAVPSCAVFVFSCLAVEVDLERSREPTALALLLLSGLAAAALFESACQVLTAEWPLVHHEPLWFVDLADGAQDVAPAEERIRRTRAVLTASDAVAEAAYFKSNARGARSRTWALRSLLTSPGRACMLQPLCLAEAS